MGTRFSWSSILRDGPHSFRKGRIQEAWEKIDNDLLKVLVFKSRGQKAVQSPRVIFESHPPISLCPGREQRPDDYLEKEYFWSSDSMSQSLFIMDDGRLDERGTKSGSNLGKGCSGRVCSEMAVLNLVSK